MYIVRCIFGYVCMNKWEKGIYLNLYAKIMMVQSDLYYPWYLGLADFRAKKPWIIEV